MEKFSQSSSWTLAEDFRHQKGQKKKKIPLQPERMKEKKKKKRKEESEKGPAIQQEAANEESSLTQ